MRCVTCQSLSARPKFQEGSGAASAGLGFDGRLVGSFDDGAEGGTGGRRKGGADGLGGVTGGGNRVSFGRSVDFGLSVDDGVAVDGGSGGGGSGGGEVRPTTGGGGGGRGAGFESARDRSAHLRLWALLEKRDGRTDVARALFGRAAAADPTDAATWLQWGQFERRVSGRAWPPPPFSAQREHLFGDVPGTNRPAVELER